MRKPAAWPKPFALMVSARLGGFRAALKVRVCSLRYILAVYLASGERGARRRCAVPRPAISAWWAGKVQACPHYAGMRTGRDSMPRTKLEYTRFGSPPPPYLVKRLEHLLPHYFQLQFGEPHADAAMNAESERQVGAGPGAIDDKVV